MFGWLASDVMAIAAVTFVFTTVRGARGCCADRRLQGVPRHPHVAGPLRQPRPREAVDRDNEAIVDEPWRTSMSEDAKTNDDSTDPDEGDASDDDDSEDQDREDALTPELDVNELPVTIGGP